MQKELSPSKTLQSIQVLYGALIIGITNFGFVLIVLYFLDIIPLSEIPVRFIFNMMGVSSLLMIVSFLGGRLFLKKAIEKSFNEPVLVEKLKIYRKGLLASGLLLDFSAFLSLAIFMASIHVSFLIIAGVALVLILKDFPTKAKTIKLLQLNYSDEHNLSAKDINENS